MGVYMIRSGYRVIFSFFRYAYAYTVHQLCASLHNKYIPSMPALKQPRLVSAKLSLSRSLVLCNRNRPSFHYRACSSRSLALYPSLACKKHIPYFHLMSAYHLLFAVNLLNKNSPFTVQSIGDIPKHHSP